MVGGTYLSSDTGCVGAGGVGAHGHGGEKVFEGAIAKVRRHRPESQKVLQGALHQQTCHNALHVPKILRWGWAGMGWAGMGWAGEDRWG